MNEQDMTLPFRPRARDVRLVGIQRELATPRLPSCNACMKIAARRDIHLGYETAVGRVIGFTHVEGRAYALLAGVEGYITSLPVSELVADREALVASLTLEAV